MSYDVESADKLNECNDGKRSSEVLLKTLEELEKVKQENKKLKQLLEIVKKYLSLIKRNVSVGSLAYTYVENAKTEIKELEK